MGYNKELDRKAKEIAELTIKEIYKDCDWALDDEDFQNLELFAMRKYDQQAQLHLKLYQAHLHKVEG